MGQKYHKITVDHLRPNSDTRRVVCKAKARGMATTRNAMKTVHPIRLYVMWNPEASFIHHGKALLARDQDQNNEAQGQWGQRAKQFVLILREASVSGPFANIFIQVSHSHDRVRNLFYRILTDNFS